MLIWILIACAFMELKIGSAFNITICTKFKCPDLSEYNITCKFVENNIDCLRSMNKNEVQLSYATEYEAIPATKLLPDIDILGVVKDSATSSQWKYEIVVVTNRPVANFEELKDFTYCTYIVGETATPKYILDGLERAILNRYVSPNCGSKNTFQEEQVCNINEFFGPSCRAWQWIYKIETGWDYPKLCQVCPRNSCNAYYPPDKCLQSNRASVIVTTLFNATTIWNPNLYYLCQNGSTSTEPCVWHKQSWPLIFTHKSLKQSNSTQLNEVLSLCAIQGKTICLYTVAEVLTRRFNFHLSVLNETETREVITTLQSYKLDSSTNKPIRWCTVSELEYEKCNWLKVFSGTLVYPIDCILRDSKGSCIRAIEIYEADMMEIVKMPTRSTILPIALSTKPYSLYIEKPSTYESMCRDIFYHIDSKLSMASKIHSSCPFGLSFRTICTNDVCHYHSEVIMRIDDPNRENAKLLLEDFLTTFNEASDEVLFDFFGKFNGVRNLLLQYLTDNFYFVTYNRKDYIQTTTKPIPKWTRARTKPTNQQNQPTKPKPEPSFSGWSILGILVFVIIFIGFCCYKGAYVCCFDGPSLHVSSYVGGGTGNGGGSGGNGGGNGCGNGGGNGGGSGGGKGGDSDNDDSVDDSNVGTGKVFGVGVSHASVVGGSVVDNDARPDELDRLHRVLFSTGVDWSSGGQSSGFNFGGLRSGGGWSGRSGGGWSSGGGCDYDYDD